MDTETTETRLHLRPDLPAEIWAEPSREQWFWVRHAGRWFAPSPAEERGLVRWFGRFFVVPSTNVTNLSLQYQCYLNDIFHLRTIARVAHFTCMPLITALLLAGLTPLHVGPVDGGQLGTAVLIAWWGTWAVRERLPLWGAVTILWALAIHAGAQAFVATGRSPWPWLVLAAFVQAGSHGLEPQLPPRVSGTAHWQPTLGFLFGTPAQPLPWWQSVRRMAHLAETLAHGTFDEAIASPRLAPIQVLEVLWLLGYAPGLRARWKGLSARAVATGNPAIDYIGVGGGTTLRWPGGG
jgi:hypothetical protein